MHEKAKSQWFESWFASPYYHLLYKNRNDHEATVFIKNLVSFLNIPIGSKIHDNACGAGRHSIALHKLGFDVLGSDLSEPSILIAKKKEEATLKFEVSDMRETHYTNTFDYVFNIFTSFGYFEDLKDNLKSLKAFHQSLKNDGFLIIDFLNATKVKNNLVEHEIKKVDQITFNLNRFIKNGIIHKNIQFEADNQNYEFEEKVQAIELFDFQSLLKEANFKLIYTFGDYQLNPFNENDSDRLILIVQKTGC